MENHQNIVFILQNVRNIVMFVHGFCDRIWKRRNIICSRLLILAKIKNCHFLTFLSIFQPKFSDSRSKFVTVHLKVFVVFNIHWTISNFVHLMFLISCKIEIIKLNISLPVLSNSIWQIWAGTHKIRVNIPFFKFVVFITVFSWSILLICKK
jgi:hypothetical protein